MKDYRDKAKSMQGDKLGRYGAPKERADGGGLRKFVDDYVAPGLTTGVGSAIASGIRKLRGPSETEKAIKDVAIDGAMGASAGHLGRAGRFGRGMPMDGQEDRARGGRLKRAEGGRISDDSKAEAARLRASANEKASAAGAGTLGAGMGAAQLIGSALMRRTGVPASVGEKIGNALGAGAIAGGAGKIYADREKIKAAKAENEEASRIERGRAEPGKEDRARGGRIGKGK